MCIQSYSGAKVSSPISLMGGALTMALSLYYDFSF